MLAPLQRVSIISLLISANSLPSDWSPPLLGILIEELDLGKQIDVIPIGKDSDRETFLDILLELLNFCGEELVFGVYYQESAVVGGIEARVGLTEHFNVKALSAQVIVQLLEVGVQVVTVPIKWLVL